MIKSSKVEKKTIRWMKIIVFKGTWFQKQIREHFNRAKLFKRPEGPKAY
jgi:hypothetical protein